MNDFLTAMVAAVGTSSQRWTEAIIVAIIAAVVSALMGYVLIIPRIEEQIKFGNAERIRLETQIKENQQRADRLEERLSSNLRSMELALERMKAVLEERNSGRNFRNNQQ